MAGGSDALRVRIALLVAAFVATALGQPAFPAHHGHACLPPNDAYPFCDTTLAVADRVADLLSRLTLQQKIQNTYDRQTQVAALGLPDLNWNTEARCRAS